jgi:hypothetical protein
VLEEDDQYRYPAWVLLKLRRWKGNSNATKKAQYLRLYANRDNVTYCPVVALYVWLRVTGIRSGPIFPALNKTHTAVRPGVLLETGTYCNWIKKMFFQAGNGLELCSTHSFRRSAVKWAVRCGLDTHLIIDLGRWSSASVGNASFMRYIKDGVARYAASKNGVIDPVWAFWKFVTEVVDPGAPIGVARV